MTTIPFSKRLPVRTFTLKLSILLGVTLSVTFGQTNIGTGSSPDSVAVNPVTNKIYVANYDSNNVTVIDGANNSTSTVATGTNPRSLAINPVTNKIYVANQLSNNITVIDGTNNSTATVPSGRAPVSVAVNPVTNKIYVANQGSVTVIDGTNNSTSTVAVGRVPVSVAVNPVTNRIYVANQLSNSVTVIDGANNSTSTVAAETSPSSVVVNPVTNKIYVANQLSNSVTVIDGVTNSTSTVASGMNPVSVAVNPVTNKIYVANQSSSVTVIDGANNSTSTVTAGETPNSVVVNPVTNKIYVANYGSNNVTAIDGANNSTSTVAAGSHPWMIAVSPVTNKIYVANYSSNNVMVIDGANNSTSTISAGTAPNSVMVNPVTNRIYVANSGSNNVTVINGANNSTSTISAGAGPLAINPVTNKIYVASSGSNVTVIDGVTNSTSIAAAGTNPVSVAVNPVTNKIYVASFGSNNVTVIDGANNSTSTVTTEFQPSLVAVNPATNKVYVANQLSNNVTVIDGANNSTSTVAAGTNPVSVTVNPVTNRIYVANQNSNSVTVIDGVTNSTSTVAVGKIPVSVEVNPLTNKVYVANQLSNNVTVIDGANNSTSTVAAGSSPYWLAINPVTNKIYVANRHSNDITVIDGASNSTSTVVGGTEPFSLAANPVTNKIYVANLFSDNVTVVTEQEVHAPPLTTSITPLSNNQTADATPTFTFSASSTFSPTVTTPDKVFYQTDTWQGAWSEAAGGGGTYTGTLAALLPGFHILYAYAGDGQEATSTQAGSPLIGAIQAYGFLVVPPPPVPLTQTITFNTIAGVTYGVAPFQLAATASSNLQVTYTGGIGNVCSVTAAGLVTILGAGQCTVIANQPGNATYSAATSIAQIFTVSPKLGPALKVTKTHSGNVVPGQTGVKYTVTVSNAANAGPTDGGSNGEVVVIDTASSSSLTNIIMAGNGWSCSQNGCFRSDVLQPGSSYPSITVTANVPAAASASFANIVEVHYGNSPAVVATASDQTTLQQTQLAPTLTPASGSGSTQLFTFTFPSPSGYQNLAGAQIVINSALTAVNSCYILFARPDVISLAANSGNAFQSTSLGAPAVLQNSQCVVLASLTSQSGSGNTVTLMLDVVFKASFAGPKTVWANYNTNAGVSAGYSQLGTYTATTPQSGFTSSVIPSSGQGQAQAFTFNYFDAYGASDISGAQVAFNSTLSGVNACYILLSAENAISLASDDAVTFKTAVLGQQGVLQNSQCSVFPGMSYQTQSGQTLSFTVFVAFKPGFIGSKNIYSSVNNNAGTSSGFSTLGTWNVTGDPGLSPTSVYPSAASGPSQALTFVFANPNGVADIQATEVIINPTNNSTANSCLILFTPATGDLVLFADDGQDSASAKLGQPGVLQNSRCIVNAAGSSQISSGTYLTLTLFLTMKTSGVQNVYSFLNSPTLGDSALQQVGTWNVTSPPVMKPVSVTPFTGAGAAGSPQFLTFTLSDPLGAADISGSLIVLYPSLQGANGCYILWGHDNNLLSLASDNVQSFSSAKLGTLGLLSNSQCTLDPSQSFAVQTGNTVNLTLAIAFKAAYQQFKQIYSWVNVQDQNHALSGWFVESRFTVQ